MEIDDSETNVLKRKHLENGDDDDGHKIEQKATKPAICNGENINGSESRDGCHMNSVKNGDCDISPESNEGCIEDACVEHEDQLGKDAGPCNVSEDFDNTNNASCESPDGVKNSELESKSKSEGNDFCEKVDETSLGDNANGTTDDQEVNSIKSNGKNDFESKKLIHNDDVQEEQSVVTVEKFVEKTNIVKKSAGEDDIDNQKSDEVMEVDEVSMEKTDYSELTDKNDSEKENITKDQPEIKHITDNRVSKDFKATDLKESNDDVEIIGESKLIKVDSPSLANSNSQSVILMTPMMNNSFSPNSSSLNSSFSPGHPLSNVPPGFMMNGPRGISPSPMSLIQGGSHAPPKPKSSLDQIELIRWEIQNRLNTRPKYFKPNPSAELGPLAKFLFDIGSNLIKEAVYHELVKIQSKKNDDDTLSDKEKEDLGKLKEIEKDLHSTIGHLKLKMKKRCKICNFQTESTNVLYKHKQFPHEDDKKLHCAHCSFVTKQPMTFKFHIEAEHGIQPRLHDKKSYFECDLCPYENNQEQKLTIHKQRCTKQFRPLFNLHPSCLSGAEINLCLENIFYKPVIPKNLKILQQKHAQQQAALAEARRQQAEVQALAAQKNAAAIAAKKQQQRHIAPAAQRYNPPNAQQFPTRPQGPTMPTVRYNSRTATPTSRPTVANMLKEKHSRPGSQYSPAQNPNAPGGFEVCEICGGYVKDRKALRIHFFYAHRIDLPFNLFDRNQPPLYCATCYVRFWTAQGLRKHIDVHVQEKKIPDGFMGEGVHGKCISCSQLVGNIVVHMRVVHNREIHHYINALMCMFCGASFNSRPNVERHITDVHGTIDIATGAVKVKARLKSSPQQSKQPSSNQKKTSGGKDNLVKGSVCVLCNLNFGRNVDLTRHCMRMHHTCMKCGMVVIDKASLLKHTCLSSPSGTRDCTMCSETGFHPAYYVKHLRDKHLRKFSITVARVSPQIIEKWIKRPYPFKSKEDELVEISDSDDEVSSTKVKIVQPPRPLSVKLKANLQRCPKKKPRIGPASKIGRPISEKEVGVDNEMIPTSVSPSGGGKRKLSAESTPERMSKRRK